MFAQVATGRASKPVLCSFDTMSTDRANLSSKTCRRQCGIVCGQREGLENSVGYTGEEVGVDHKSTEHARHIIRRTL
jgi:hypothetical protein